jgi:hypothetical protein
MVAELGVWLWISHVDNVRKQQQHGVRVQIHGRAYSHCFPGYSGLLLQ